MKQKLYIKNGIQTCHFPLGPFCRGYLNHLKYHLWRINFITHTSITTDKDKACTDEWREGYR